MFLGCEADMDVGVGEETERGLQAWVVSYSDNQPAKETGHENETDRKQAPSFRVGWWTIKVIGLIDYLRHK